MVELNSIPNVPLKIIFSIHFVLITWGIQGFWSPDSYLFYNFFFLIAVLWGIHTKDSEEPLQIAIFLNTISVVLDIFTLTIFYHNTLGSSDTFSLLMAIVNLVFRPVSILLMSKMCADRMGISGGVFPSRFGNIFGCSSSTDTTSARENNRAAGGGAVEPHPRV